LLCALQVLELAVACAEGANVRIVSVCFAKSNWEAVLRHLDAVAPRVEGIGGLQWNYPSLREPMVFLSDDPHFVDAFEEEDEIAELLRRSEGLSLATLSVRLRLHDEIGRASVQAARQLALELLLRFDGFVHDENGEFWSREEIVRGVQKHGLRFLQEEDEWFAS